MRVFGPFIPFLLGLALLAFAAREKADAVAGDRRFPEMSSRDLAFGPFALAFYGLALVGLAVALWVNG